MTPTSHYLPCAGREIHYLEWGPGDGPVVVAWHGLARTCRDMDELAAHLAGRGFRVICPDTLGRGLSQWSPDPDAEYQLSFYARLAADLCGQLQLDRVHWVGTSMGGAIGMVCASGLFESSMKQRIVRLVLNDTAPQVADAAIARIRGYAGSPPAFDTVTELEDLLPHGLQALRLAQRRAVAAPDRKLHAPPAGRPGDAALRPGHGAAVQRA